MKSVQGIQHRFKSLFFQQTVLLNNNNNKGKLLDRFLEKEMGDLCSIDIRQRVYSIFDVYMLEYLQPHHHHLAYKNNKKIKTKTYILGFLFFNLSHISHINGAIHKSERYKGGTNNII